MEAGATGGDSYSYKDINSSRAITYYRLKQTDVDGAFTYSKIVSVSPNDHLANVGDHISLTQVNGALSITSATGLYELKVYSFTGRLLSSQKFNCTGGGNAVEYLPGEACKGLVILCFTDCDGNTVKRKHNFQ